MEGFLIKKELIRDGEDEIITRLLLSYSITSGKINKVTNHTIILVQSIIELEDLVSRTRRICNNSVTNQMVLDFCNYLKSNFKNSKHNESKMEALGIHDFDSYHSNLYTSERYIPAAYPIKEEEIEKKQDISTIRRVPQERVSKLNKIKERALSDNEEGINEKINFFSSIDNAKSKLRNTSVNTEDFDEEPGDTTIENIKEKKGTYSSYTIFMLNERLKQEKRGK